MDNTVMTILMLALVGALVFGAVLGVQRESGNLCAKTTFQDFPFNATKQTIRSKYGNPDTVYTKGSTVRWVYTYPKALSVGKCKMVVIFQQNKVVDYEMKEKGKGLFGG